MRIRFEDMEEMFGVSGEGGGFEAPPELAGIFDLPERLPAPPPPTPVAPIRTAPIPLPRPSAGVSKLSISGAGFADSIRVTLPPLSLIPEEVRPELPMDAFVRPPPRVTVPPMQQPCPPGFVRR